MCGICGMVVHRNARVIERSIMEKMCAAMTHRGPDAEGFLLTDRAALGHRRLKIIDLETGDQPIYNESRTVAVVFNGEIYNHASLRKELERKGHVFTTRTDTEVIPHLYEEHGEGAVHCLRGMFAFALWDTSNRRLLLARDRMGEKPLFYSLCKDGALFASEIKSLLASGQIGNEVDYTALDSYLTNQFIPAPMTIYKKIRKLPPAHLALWEEGKWEIRRYWELSGETHDMGEDECAHQLMSLLREAVEMRLMSDVPLGAFLSGGLDSSLMVALMAQCLRERVKTFSIGFKDESYNELPASRRVAMLLGSEPYEKVVDYQVEELLPRFVWHFDEPFGDSSALPLYHLCQLARERVVVALSGDGCDETLGGYRRYTIARVARYAALLPAPFYRKFLDKFLNMLPDGTEYYGTSFRKKLRLFSEHLESLREMGVASWYVNFNRRDKERLYSPELTSRLRREGDADPIEQWVSGPHGPDRLAEMMRVDIHFYLPDDILVKVDRMSMAHSLEVRPPFLDHVLQEFIATIPTRLKVRGSELKYVLKRAAKDTLPSDIIRRPKHGFQVPLGSWFRGELKGYLRNIVLKYLKELFQQDYLEELLDEHQLTKHRDHGQKLWTLLILALWLKGHSNNL